MLNNRDREDLDSQGDASSQPDTISIASRTSQNTLDSDKVSVKICQRKSKSAMLHPVFSSGVLLTCLNLQHFKNKQNCLMSVLNVLASP